MLDAVRRRLTYANTMATLAVFIALGGVSYAAVTLPRNSVGARQIKAEAVNSEKVKDGSLLPADFKAGALPVGATGAAGPAGPLGPTGPGGPAGPGGPVGQGGPIGPQGPTGDPGAAGAKGDKGDKGNKGTAGKNGVGGLVNSDGTIVQGSGFTVTHASDGEYQVSFPNGTLAADKCPPIVTATAFSGLVRNPQLSGRTCSGLGAGSFTIKTLDSAGVARDTPFAFIALT